MARALYILIAIVSAASLARAQSAPAAEATTIVETTDTSAAVAAPAAPVETTAAAVVSKPTPLSRAQFIDALAKDLAAHFNLDGDLRLELLRTWTSPAVVASDWQLNILEYPSAPASSMLVRCRVLADGASAAEFSVTLHASLWSEVWATRQPLSPGTAFDAGILDSRRVDVLREHDVVLTNSDQRGYNFSRAVPAGHLLTWHDLARRPLVRKGDAVEVSASDGLLVITMKALALESGAQGDTVVVRNPESHKDFPATVVDHNHVQVHF